LIWLFQCFMQELWGNCQASYPTLKEQF